MISPAEAVKGGWITVRGGLELPVLKIAAVLCQMLSHHTAFWACPSSQGFLLPGCHRDLASPPPPNPSPGCAATSSLQQDFLCAMKMLGRCVWISSNLGSAKCRNQPEDIRIHTEHPCLFLLPWFHSGLSAGQPQDPPSSLQTF